MRRLLLLATAAVLLPACGVFDDDDDDAPAAPVDGTALLEVVHASSNAPNVNLFLNGTPLRAGTNVPFKAALAARVTPDENSLEVEAIIPGGNSVVIGPADVATPDDTRVTVFAANLVADIEPIVLSAPEAELGAGEARVRVLHAAPTVTPVAAMVDIYVTAPDADLAAEAPLTTLMFGEASAEPGAVVPAGDYRIRVTPAGDDTVVFDSGTVAVAEGADLIVAAVDSTVPGDAPISLLVLDGTGALEILDSETPSTVRVVHASPDAPNVDVLVDDAPSGIADLAFGDATDRIPLPAAEYNFKVVPTGETEPVVIDEDLGLVAGVEYSVFAAGLLADLDSMEDDALPIGALVLTDDDRSIGTEAKLRVVHTSPAAGNVDIYLVEQGADIADIDPTLADVPFLANSGYLSVPPGAYDVIVTVTGSKMPAIGPAPVTLDAGGVYTAAARDADGGGAPLSLILLDDFVAP